MPVPMFMFTRRIVRGVVGAGVNKKGAAEEKQDQLALPEPDAAMAMAVLVD
jgi:hypothetical protein